MTAVCYATAPCFAGEVGARASVNDSAGFELLILRVGFQTTDCYSVERTGLINSRGIREPILYFSISSALGPGSFSPPLLSGGFLESRSKSSTLDLAVTNRRLWLLHVSYV